MIKVKCINNSDGYQNYLEVGKVYDGEIEPGIYANRPFIAIYDPHGIRICIAHLSRFEVLTND